MDASALDWNDIALVLALAVAWQAYAQGAPQLYITASIALLFKAIVIPVVLAVIYILLYLTYHSLLEATHVLMAVPFALSGGIYLLYASGYNFSVAVWVGFISLFGTAVQTAVVAVKELPRTAHGKLDYQRLAAPVGSAVTQ